MLSSVCDLLCINYETNVLTESLQNCKLNGNLCGGVTMVSSTTVRTSWMFYTGTGNAAET